MIIRPDHLGAYLRTQLRLFLVKAFEELHPGAPPLGAAWYLDAICHELEEVAAGRQRRLVVTVPPRQLKSITAAVAFVAWRLGRDPTAKIMVASYSQDLARLHANQCRQVIESGWYRKLFPNTRIDERNNRALEIVTTAGGVRKAVSVGGSVTGFGADLIIVDDCMKADEARSQTMRDELKAWFTGTLVTRLNDKERGTIISIQQRLHEDDLPAFLLEKGYAHLNLPAIAEAEEVIPLTFGRMHRREVGDLLDPARAGRSTLDNIRREIGPVAFAAQYQQNPTVPEGNLLRLEWFKTYDEAPPRERLLKVVQSWDLGFSASPTSDYSVCTTWGFRDHRWYCLDVFRERLDYPDLKRAVLRLAKQWRADLVLIEKAGTGIALGQEVRQEGLLRPIMISPVASKEDRLNGCLADIEAGHFYLPTQAPWLDAFRSELRAFPNGKHDDQVDSVSQFIRHQLRHWRWILTTYTPGGRLDYAPRDNRRPW